MGLSRYDVIRDDLRGRILAGEWDEVGLWPPLGEFEKHYRAAKNTVRRAQKELAEEGLVEIRRGHRTRVLHASANGAHGSVAHVRGLLHEALRLIDAWPTGEHPPRY